MTLYVNYKRPELPVPSQKKSSERLQALPPQKRCLLLPSGVEKRNKKKTAWPGNVLGHEGNQARQRKKNIVDGKSKRKISLQIFSFY